MIILFGKDTVRDHFTTPFYFWNLSMYYIKLNIKVLYSPKNYRSVWMYEIIITITRLYV